MVYAATTGVIIYYKPDLPYYLHRYHHEWFGEYRYRVYIEDRHTTVYLIVQQDSESLIHNSDILNLVPYYINLTYTPFCDANISHIKLR